MRFVPLKTTTQQDVQALHRIRAQLIKWRTGLANEIRGRMGEYVQSVFSRDERWRLRSLQLGGIVAHVALHPEGRVQGAMRVILVRYRRSEERENSVAG